jgi:hypothetical protein
VVVEVNILVQLEQVEQVEQAVVVQDLQQEQEQLEQLIQVAVVVAEDMVLLFQDSLQLQPQVKLAEPAVQES